MVGVGELVGVTVWVGVGELVGIGVKVGVPVPGGQISEQPTSRR